MRVMHILRAEAQQNCTSDAHDSVCNNNNSSYSLTEYITCSQWLRNVELVLAFAVSNAFLASGACNLITPRESLNVSASHSTTRISGNLSFGMFRCLNILDPATCPDFV